MECLLAAHTPNRKAIGQYLLLVPQKALISFEALLQALLLALTVEDNHPVKLHDQRLRIIIKSLCTR